MAKARRLSRACFTCAPAVVVILNMKIFSKAGYTGNWNLSSLLDVYEARRDSIDFRITMSLTPLANMLADELLQNRAVKHIRDLIELAEKEVERTRWMSEFHETAKMYLEKFERCRYLFEEVYRKNLINGFKRFQELGKLEVITCGATHGFMPLMDLYPNAVRAQIQVARQDYERHFGRPPRGIWNGECGYYPGLETFLSEAGIRFFFVDSHGILHADRRPRYGVLHLCTARTMWQPLVEI